MDITRFNDLKTLRDNFNMFIFFNLIGCLIFKRNPKNQIFSKSYFYTPAFCGEVVPKQVIAS